MYLPIYGSKSHSSKGFESQVTRGRIRDMKDVLLEILFDDLQDQKSSRKARTLDIPCCCIDFRTRESSRPREY